MAVYLGDKQVNMLGGQPIIVEGIDTSSDIPVTASDMVAGKEAFVNGEKVVGNMATRSSLYALTSTVNVSYEEAVNSYGVSLPAYIKLNGDTSSVSFPAEGAFVPLESTMSISADASEFGDASISDVAAGKTFTSVNGLKLRGTAEPSSGGLVIKTGTIVSNNVINTGLSSVEQFVLYRTSLTSTGLMQATYNKELGASCIYCSSYSSYVRSCTVGTTAPTINGGTVTWGASGNTGMASNITYNWVAIGTA